MVTTFQPNRPPLTAMGVRNIITEPLDEDSPLPRGTHMIRGRAWSGMGAIDRVEVSGQAVTVARGEFRL